MTEGFDRDKAINICPVIVTRFYGRLSVVYEKHVDVPDHIWNYDEIGLHVGRNYGMHVVSKRGSINVPKILPKCKEWVTIMCCANAISASIPWFYLFKGKSHLKNISIIMKQGNAWLHIPMHG